MRAVVQRVSRAEVSVDQAVVAAIDKGLLVLAGVGHGDGPADAAALGDKIAGLRIFGDDAGKMNLAVGDAGGSALIVSQFTLLADVRRGRRPSFVEAAHPDVAAPLIEQVADRIRNHGVDTSTGHFGAHMRISLVNDGPVTIVLETRDGKVV